MTRIKITGSFTVELEPLELSFQGEHGALLSRMSIRKTFNGGMKGQSRGEMLSAKTPVQGSAGYVAIEQVQAQIGELKGSFVLQHFGTMSGSSHALTLEVVPDSGAGDLRAISGHMEIRMEGGEHFYDFTYQIPQSTKAATAVLDADA